jgi:CRP-like cAMP-binding protein
MLKEVKLLQKMTEAELQALIQMGVAANYEAHANVVIEGELSWGLYLILSGYVGIFKTNKLTGDIYDVGQLSKGHFFGEMSLVDENPRSATCRALTEVRVFYLSKDSFMDYLGRNPDLKLRFYENCVRDMVARLRELDDNYVISQYQLWKTAMKKEAA